MSNQCNPATPPPTHPYERLTPDLVLDALASVGVLGDGRLLALSSYENRVYQIPLEQPVQGCDVVVAKFYRPQRWSDAQILEEHQFAAELQAAEVPVVGPLALHGNTLHHFSGFAFSVSPRRGGRGPELDDFEVLEWIGRFLARIHAVGATQPFVQRPVLDLPSFGTESMNWLLQQQMIPLDVQSAWEKACRQALDMVAASSLCTPPIGRPITHLRVHGDCHPGNILWAPGVGAAAAPGRPKQGTAPSGGSEAHAVASVGAYIVDLDDARTAPAVQDLWMLLSGDRGQRTQQLSALLDGYEQFRSFDRRELALIEPLRTLRLIHYSAWLARRFDDPIFPINFPWFGTPDYWHGQVLMLQEQIEAMAEEPLYA